MMIWAYLAGGAGKVAITLNMNPSEPVTRQQMGDEP